MSSLGKEKNMGNPQHSHTAHTAEQYYDSIDADTFYRKIWGGGTSLDVHVGIYNSQNENVVTASRRTVKVMADTLLSINDNTRLLDIGSGYGGSARYLANRFGCQVDCVNISGKQNAINRQRNVSRNLSELIKVHKANFEDIPFADSTFDIVWSEDAMVHSEHRDKVVSEVARVLRSGGIFIFTDLMQSEDVPQSVLEPVLARINLHSMGSPEFYKQTAKSHGLTCCFFEDMSPHLVTHYKRVHEEIKTRHEELLETCSENYLDSMTTGLNHWIDAGEADYLVWGIFQFQKP